MSHVLSVGEQDQKVIQAEFNKIHEMDALYRLSDAALEAAKNGFVYFLRQLFNESNVIESGANA